MQEDFVKLISRARAAVERGDMLVGHVSEFGNNYLQLCRLIEIPVGVFGDLILVKMRKPLEARTRDGSISKVVAYYDGIYYCIDGCKYKEMDLHFIKEKLLP